MLLGETPANRCSMTVFAAIIISVISSLEMPFLSAIVPMFLSISLVSVLWIRSSASGWLEEYAILEMTSSPKATWGFRNDILSTTSWPESARR